MNCFTDTRVTMLWETLPLFPHAFQRALDMPFNRVILKDKGPSNVHSFSLILVACLQTFLAFTCMCVLCCVVFEWACVWRCTCADGCMCMCVLVEARGWQWGSPLVPHNLIFETGCLIGLATCWWMSAKDSPDHPYCPPLPQLWDYIGSLVHVVPGFHRVLESQLRALCLQGKRFIKQGTSSALEFISNK